MSMKLPALVIPNPDAVAVAPTNLLLISSSEGRAMGATMSIKSK